MSLPLIAKPVLTAMTGTLPQLKQFPRSDRELRAAVPVMQGK
jgi:hypothetical protein